MWSYFIFRHKNHAHGVKLPVIVTYIYYYKSKPKDNYDFSVNKTFENAVFEYRFYDFSQE